MTDTVEAVARAIAEALGEGLHAKSPGMLAAARAAIAAMQSWRPSEEAARIVERLRGTRFNNIMADMLTTEAAAVIEHQAERIAKLEKVAADAIDEIEAWSGYASDYFKDKHDLAGVLADLRARAALGEKP